TDMFNLNLSIPVTVTDWWEMNNNLSGITSHVTSKYFNESMDVSHTWYSINSTQTFTLPKKISIELSGMYYSKSLFGIYMQQPYGMISFGIRKELGENGGVVNLNFSDIFGNMVYKWSAHVPQFNLNSSINLDFDIRVVKLTYTKSFGNNKLKSRSKRQTGSEEDLKRVGN
ncbi:MAG: outer membrane beta-barrel protein, partial [Cyclobacteriaceae bacterium]|nr:outer membrane beta-barrel protein [Cyclobacteriaceae bacterium]